MTRRRLSVPLFFLLGILLSSIPGVLKADLPADSLFIIEVEDGLPGPPQEWLQKQFVQVYRSLQQKVDVSLQEPIYVGIVRPDSSTATIRGRIGGNFIQIFSTEHLSRERILGVFAHELGHQLQRTWMGGLSISPMLNEGFATWLAGGYWLRWHHLSSFDSAVRTYVNQNRYLPLETPIKEGYIREIDRRDILYDEWAAFEGYLMKQYGMPEFEHLCRLLTPKSREDLKEFDPCFEEVYGMSLPAMEKAWLASLGVQN